MDQRPRPRTRRDLRRRRPLAPGVARQEVSAATVGWDLTRLELMCVRGCDRLMALDSIVSSRPFWRGFDRSPGVRTAVIRFVRSGRSRGSVGCCRTLLRMRVRHRGSVRIGSRWRASGSLRPVACSERPGGCANIYGVDACDRRYKELLAKLDQLVTLLTRCDVSDWVDWLTRARESLAHSDAQGLDHLRSAFGGMGSLNDLVIHPMNGHTVDAGSIDRLNDELTRLRSDVYRLAITLRRSLDG